MMTELRWQAAEGIDERAYWGAVLPDAVADFDAQVQPCAGSFPLLLYLNVCGSWRGGFCCNLPVLSTAQCVYPSVEVHHGRSAQAEAAKNAVLGPRQRRQVTYNEERLAQKAAAAAALTPAKKAPDEDSAPDATAAEDSSDSGGSEVEEGADGVADKPRTKVHDAQCC